VQVVQLDCNHAVPANIASAEDRDKLGFWVGVLLLSFWRGQGQGRAGRVGQDKVK